jgi:hypothetical protein
MQFKQERQSENVVIFVKFRETYTFMKKSFLLANLGKKFVILECEYVFYAHTLRNYDRLTV